MPTTSASRRSAAEFVVSDIAIAGPDESTKEVWRRLRGSRLDSADDLVVVSMGKVAGMVRLEDLIAAPGDTSMSDIMDPEPPVVKPGMDREHVAWQAVAHGERSLAVVDDDGMLIGLIPATRMLGVLLKEHADDMARLAGYLRSTASAREATEERIGRRYIHRLPWLLVGLAGSLVAALIVSGYEEQLASNLSLAFFLPGIVYLADAVGTQTEAVVVRGLSVGASIGTTLRREVLTGFLIGASLAIAFVPIGLALVDQDVMAVVAISIFAACAVATAVAMSLPAILYRLGTDPAFGSGPLATVIQDLLSILIYFGVAMALLG
jgi:magnesium transporter